jgi:hypothetical protein
MRRRDGVLLFLRGRFVDTFTVLVVPACHSFGWNVLYIYFSIGRPVEKVVV